MVGNIKGLSASAAAVYEQAKKIKGTAGQIQNHRPAPNFQGAQSSAHVPFKDMLKGGLQDMKRTVQKSEFEAKKVVMQTPDADPVSAALLAQEAQHSIKLTGEVVTRLVKAFEEVTKINL